MVLLNGFVFMYSTALAGRTRNIIPYLFVRKQWGLSGLHNIVLQIDFAARTGSFEHGLRVYESESCIGLQNDKSNGICKC